jgi:hypothetical protein
MISDHYAGWRWGGETRENYADAGNKGSAED